MNSILRYVCRNFTPTLQQLKGVFSSLVRLIRPGRKSVVSVSSALFLGVAACAQTSQLPPAVAYLDIDSDGTLQFEEVGPTARKVFTTFDIDNSGALDRAELGPYFRWAMARARDRRERLKNVNLEQFVINADSSAADVDAVFDLMIESLAVEEAIILVGHGDDLIYSRRTDGMTHTDIVPVASASKLFSAAVLLSAVDRGLIELSAPASAYLPNAPEAWGSITIDQLFSMTSGAADGHALSHDPRLPNAEIVDDLMQSQPANPPGTTFRYGGVGMQIAGRALEVQAQKSWQEAVDAWIVEPLGLQSAEYVHPTWVMPEAEIRSPNVGAGLQISPYDYYTFLQMVAGNGVLSGDTVLSSELVSQLFIDRTVGLDRASLPDTVSEDWGYSLGTWCERANEDGVCPVISSAGAFGTFPWVDRETGIFGVLVVVDRNPDVMPFSKTLRRLVTDLYVADKLPASP